MAELNRALARFGFLGHNISLMEKRIYTWQLPLCVAKALVLRLRSHLRARGFEEVLNYMSPAGPDSYELVGPEGKVFITVTSLGPDRDEVKVESDFPVDGLVREAVESLINELREISQKL